MWVDDLRHEASRVTLHVGDMVYDVRTKSRGFLTKRERRIDIVEDDIYIWSIYWVYNGSLKFNNPSYLEEDGLKMSITVGTIELTSITERDKND